MNNRNYNIFFHTHTISGIFISALLYVIFFAGSFSFFKSEINNWEANTLEVKNSTQDIRFQSILDSLNREQDLFSRDISFYLPEKNNKIGVQFGPKKDTISAANADQQKKEKKGRRRGDSTFFILDNQTNKTSTYMDSYSLGEFLYRLHFFAQIPYPYGYHLAGFVSFIFLFAIITGVLLHWNKIVSNFYIFRPWSKLKTLWTDAHTALGIIGLPYQFIFAVTGAYFMINIVFTAPVTQFLYEGNRDAMFADMGYTDPKAYPFENTPLGNEFNIVTFLEKTEANWSNSKVTRVSLQNYGDQSMTVTVEGQVNNSTKLTGNGKVVYQVNTGKILEEKKPMDDATYSDVVKSLLYKLHFGNYGGYALKIMYFLVGIASCFVIISGVMIWLIARDRKNIPVKKRIFNEWLVNIYLAVCLSMYPMTALIFIAVKVYHPAGQDFIYRFYFIGWLLLSLYFIVRKNNYITTRDTLLLGSVFGFLVPIANGIMTDNWLWISYIKGYNDLLFIDLLWLVISVITFISWLLMVRKHKNKSLIK